VLIAVAVDKKDPVYEIYARKLYLKLVVAHLSVFITDMRHVKKKSMMILSHFTFTFFYSIASPRQTENSICILFSPGDSQTSRKRVVENRPMK
jgi:hypothetical protein